MFRHERVCLLSLSEQQKKGGGVLNIQSPRDINNTFLKLCLSFSLNFILFEGQTQPYLLAPLFPPFPLLSLLSCAIHNMCKHVINAQVSIRASCCKKWFDCAECHREVSNHPLTKSWELVFGCKKCKKVFRKNMKDFEEADEYCPYCDNHFVLPAKGSQRNYISGFEKTKKLPQEEFVILKKAPQQCIDNAPFRVFP